MARTSPRRVIARVLVTIWRSCATTAQSSCTARWWPPASARRWRAFGRYRALGMRMGLGTDTAPPDLIAGHADGHRTVSRDGRRPRSVPGRGLFRHGDTGRGRCARPPGSGPDRGRGLRRSGRVRPGPAAPAPGDRSDPDPDAHRPRPRRPDRHRRRPVRHGGSGDPGYRRRISRPARQAQFDRLLALYPDRTWSHPPLGEIFRSSYPLAE